MQNGSLRRPREDTLPNAIQEDIGRTALHEAASIGDEKTLQTLLAAGADRNAKDLKHGNSPLHEASWRGFSRCVKLLCALPQPKATKDVKEGKLKGVLQETRGALHSALLGTRNSGGFSALHLAAQNGHNQSCREILLAGADPDVQNNYGDTPLHTACRYGHAGATRILISAKCDPNRTNLNGDTPLHISCAMGRRKLTRILLEAGSNLDIKNAQGETPKDIAIRKNLPEILEILNSPVQVKAVKEPSRDRSSSNSKNNDKTDGPTKPKGTPKRSDYGANPINWSPYGCHYFPDPRSFPSPKLETLPKEPLGKGEQYYLDLAGNIRKGPIGVGNTCYCGPFFRHIEERISKNRKSLRKFVHKATERLDNKVQALALRTDDQIEQLTRSMMADRIRCEGRRLHLEQWLKRGDAARVTVSHHPKSKKNIDNVNTLTRCRSLELLDDEDCLDSRKMQNSRSFDLLEEADVIVHRNPEPSDDQRLNSSSVDSDRKTSKVSERSRSSGGGERDTPFEGDTYSVSKRLEELLAKTNEILEMEKLARQKHKDVLTSSKYKSKEGDKSKTTASSSSNRHSTLGDHIIEQYKKMSLATDQHKHHNKDVNSTEIITQEMNKIATSLSQQNNDIIDDRRFEDNPPLSPEISKDLTSQKETERKSDQEQEKSSIISGSSHKNPSSVGSGYIPDFSKLRSNRNRRDSDRSINKPPSSGGSEQNPKSPVATARSSREYQNIIEAHEADAEKKFKDLLSALRRDYQSTKESIEEEILKERSFQNLTQIYEYAPTVFSEDIIDSVVHEGIGLSDFYQNPCLENTTSSSNTTLKSMHRQQSLEHSYTQDPEDTTELSEMANVNEINELKSRILNGSNWRSQVLKKTQQMANNCKEEGNNKGINGIVQKFEIKNSEIKTLKSPTSGILKRSKVQQLVAKIQGVTGSSSNSRKQTIENSESSEEEEQEDEAIHMYANKEEPLGNIPNGRGSHYYYNRAQPQVAVAYQQHEQPPTTDGHSQEISTNNSRILDTRNLIPKDAYFHELPNKNRMRPIIDKLPEKQMLNFTDQYKPPPHSHSMVARTRNPLPYFNDYDISVQNGNIAHNEYTGGGKDMSSMLQQNLPGQMRQIPHREKLLAHRKFPFSNGIDYELSRINYNQQHYQQQPPQQQQQQQHQQQPLLPHHQHLQPSVSITPEQAQIDRDTNNDSGYSTKICGSSHGPSPSLSGHTDYGGISVNAGSDLQCEHVDNNGITYFLGNVGASSLV